MSHRNPHGSWGRIGREEMELQRHTMETVAGMPSVPYAESRARSGPAYAAREAYIAARRVALPRHLKEYLARKAAEAARTKRQALQANVRRGPTPRYDFAADLELIKPLSNAEARALSEDDKAARRRARDRVRKRPRNGVSAA